MDSPDTAQAAALVGAVGALLALVAPRRTILLGFALLAATEVLLVRELVPASDLAPLYATPVRVAGLAVAALVNVGLAVVLLRRPRLALPLLLVAAPFRIPVTLGEQEAHLLLPFYGVAAAAVLAYLYRVIRGEPTRTIVPLFSIPLAVLTVLASLSLLWSRDVEAGSIALVFFWLPFLAVVATIARGAFPIEPRVLGVALVATAVACTIVGFWQVETRTLFFGPRLEVANAYTTFFRVNSLFSDPSVYGRLLVLAIAVVLAALWCRRLRAVYAVPLLAMLWGGLYFSYSQSSMLALGVVVVAAMLVEADRRSRLIVVGAVVVISLVGASFVTAAARDESARRVTSGRSTLVADSWTVFSNHPLAGVGLGGQPRATREEANSSAAVSRNVSHTTQLTVAAEFGVVGLAAYVVVLASWALLCVRLVARDHPFGLAMSLMLLALVVHSFFYGSFFENPVAWAIPAVAAASLAQPRPREP